jgi:hypothetical protein
MLYGIKQSTTSLPLLFILIDAADHISPITGLSPDVQLSKNGSAFASPAGAITELGLGWYNVAPDATDTDTLGPLLLHATATGADPTDAAFDVVAYNPADIPGAVWDALIADHLTAGSVGQSLAAAGGAADPLLNAVPGSYASGTAGYYLGRLASSSITVTAPVISGGNVQIIRGDSYYSADARALVWSITGLPTIDLTDAVTTFSARNITSLLTKTNSSTPGVTASFLNGTLTLTLELAATDTDGLHVAAYAFDIQTIFSNSHVETWLSGTMTVVKDVR